MAQFYTFDSGLRLVLKQNTAVRSVALGIFVSNGVVCEDESNIGISHFIEHMLFKGTKNRTAFDIVKETDSIGAVINAYTSKYNTCFYVKSLDEHLEQCADILSDMYFNPLFDNKDLIKERKVIYEEINEGLDDPSDVCYQITNNKFFNGHEYGREIAGSKKTLKGITSEDLFNYYKKHYVLNKTVVSICGNVSEKQALDIVNKYFESHKDTNMEPNIKVVNPHKLTSGFVKKKKDAEQTQISIMFPAYSFEDKNKYVANVVSTMLGGGMSSRLFQNIRERLGLCYGISAYVSSLPGDGLFNIVMSTTPSKAEQALQALKKEIDSVIKIGFDEKELDRAKEQEKTGIVFSQENTNVMMRSFGTYYLNGIKLDCDDSIDFINSITMDDINKCLKEIFDYNNIVVGIVGPDVSIDLSKIFNK